jgi:U2 small nuclear ribonucleoprotein B''
MTIRNRWPERARLYVSNLPDKLPKTDLRRNLYFLFTGYGPVLDVNAAKTTKMRGQAFVVFRDVNAAAQAMRSLQGFEFFGKEMVCVMHAAYWGYFVL